MQDVLCATSLASSKNIPILLTYKSKLNENTLKEIIRLNSELVYIIGGESVIDKCVEEELDSQYSGIEISYNNIINKLGLTIDKEVINLSKDDEGNYKPTIIIKDIDNIDKEQIINFGAYEEQYEYEVITNKDDTKDKIYYRKKYLTSN